MKPEENSDNVPAQSLSPESFQTFGDLLKYLRRRENLTQLELSIAVGYSDAQITRLEKNQRLPDLAAIKALFIPALHIEHESQLVARFLELAESARQEDAPAVGVPPYKGLLFFDQADSALFFGRETLTAHLTDRITDLATDASSRFLAVVGASGSGKSSLVRAGLAVALQRAGWEIHIFTPTTNPLKMLATNYNSTRAKNRKQHLILVDQFEETFTLCRDENERAAFIERLLAIARDKLLNTTIVIALRADFYSHCAQYPLLREAVAAEQEYIGQMTNVELRRVIEEPAKRSGWEFESGLVDLLLNDIGADGMGHPEPGALPLLSHALLATWERRRGRTFTIEGYHASGGVRGAIAETAESVFTDQLNRSQQELARAIFLRLTELGEGTEDTRRRAALNELTRQSEEATQLRLVLNTLADARLITLNEDTAEVAHEALIREWERLHEWLTQDREGLRLHRHLTDSAHEWETRGRDPAELYRGARLAQMSEWASMNEERLNTEERKFITASIEQEQHETLEREAQRQRELEAAKNLAETKSQSEMRLRVRNRVITTVGSIAIILAMVAGTFGMQSNQNANAAQNNAATAQVAKDNALNSQATAQAASTQAIENFTQSEAQRLASDADTLIRTNGGPELIALLALRSLNIQYTSQGDAALTTAAGLNYPRRFLTTNSGIASGIIFSPNSGYAVIGDRGTVKLIDVQTGQSLLQFDNINLLGGVAFSWAAFSLDNQKLILSSSNVSAFIIVDTITGEVVQRFSFPQLSSVIVFSMDGTRIFVGSDTTVQELDIQTGSALQVIQLPQPARKVLFISPDGKFAITATNTRESILQLWSLTNSITLLQKFIYSEGINEIPQGIALSPDGKSFLASYLDNTVVLWDITTGKIIQSYRGHTNKIQSVAFSADGKYVLTGSSDQTARLWDTQTGNELLRVAASNPVVAVAFSSNGKFIITGCSNGTIRVWDIQPRLNLPIFVEGHNLSGVSFSPDGKFLATGGVDGLQLWNIKTSQLVRIFPNSGLIKYGLKFSPNGLYLLSGDWLTGTVSLWDVGTGKQIRQFVWPPDTTTLNANLYDVTFSPDGKYIVAGIPFLRTGAEHYLRFWDVQTAQLTGLIGQRSTGGDITRLAFSPDGQSIMVVNTVGQVRIFDKQTGFLLKRFIGTDSLNGAAFSPDGKYVATAGADNKAHLWDIKLGTEIRQFIGHTDILYSVAFSPDGNQIVTSSADGTARLWNVQTGKELRRFAGHSASVENVTFSPDGKFIATVSDDGTARLWNIDYHATMKYLCSILLRDFTDQERAQYGITDTTPTCPKP